MPLPKCVSFRHWSLVQHEQVSPLMGAFQMFWGKKKIPFLLSSSAWGPNGNVDFKGKLWFLLSGWFWASCFPSVRLFIGKMRSWSSVSDLPGLIQPSHSSELSSPSLVWRSQSVGQQLLNPNHLTQCLPSFPPHSTPSLQVRYGTVWSDYVGGTSGDLDEIFLYPGESIVQVSGKYSTYLRKLVFVTDKFRFLSFGKDKGTSFNAAPLYPNTVLRFFSGRAGSLIDAISFHWDFYPSDYESCWVAPQPCNGDLGTHSPLTTINMSKLKKKKNTNKQ